jgi:hypothetical protein
MENLMMLFSAMPLKDETHEDIVVEELDELLLNSQDDDDLIMDTSEEPVMDAAIENLMMLFNGMSLKDDTPAIEETQELTPAANVEVEPMENDAIMEALMTQPSAVTFTLINDTPVVAEQEPTPADLKLTIIEIEVAAQDEDKELTLAVATEPELFAADEELFVAPHSATTATVITTAAVDMDIDELIFLFKALTATDSLEQLPAVLPPTVVSAKIISDTPVIFEEAPALLIDVFEATEAPDTDTLVAVDKTITASPTLASVAPATTSIEEVEEPAADEPEPSLSVAPATTSIEEVEEPAADEPEPSLSVAPATTSIEEVEEPAADEPEPSLSVAPATPSIEEVALSAADEPGYTTGIEEVVEHVADEPESSLSDAPTTLWTGAGSWRIDAKRTAVNRALLVGTVLSGFFAALVTSQ